MDDPEFGERLNKLNNLKSFLNEVDKKLLFLTEFVDWDLSKLNAEAPANMVTCSLNPQHRVPSSKIEAHEEKCRWRFEGYDDSDKSFPDHSGQGSFITLDSKLISDITAGVSPLSVGCKPSRPVPNSTANLDQNFSREEKLALYDYAINNTQKPNSFPDLHLQAFEKKEEKKELSAWEIAAAERDAKRRRASYRNKVHTNRKTYTEVMREVIEVQMEILKDETSSKPVSIKSKFGKSESDEKYPEKRSKHDSRILEEEKRYSGHESWRRRNKEENQQERKRIRHSNYKGEGNYIRSSRNVGIDFNSRSRSRDNHKKRKSHEERFLYSSKSNGS